MTTLQQTCEQQPSSRPPSEEVPHPTSADPTSTRTGKAFRSRTPDPARILHQDLNNGGSRGSKRSTKWLTEIFIGSNIGSACRGSEPLDSQSPAFCTVASPIIAQLLDPRAIRGCLEKTFSCLFSCRRISTWPLGSIRHGRHRSSQSSLRGVHHPEWLNLNGRPDPTTRQTLSLD